MFVRVKRSVQESGSYEYLQIVESVRNGERVRQRVIANLGRRDRLVAEGSLDGLLVSLAKFSERLRVVEKVRTEGIQAHCCLAGFSPGKLSRFIAAERDGFLGLVGAVKGLGSRPEREMSLRG